MEMEAIFRFVSMTLMSYVIYGREIRHSVEAGGSVTFKWEINYSSDKIQFAIKRGEYTLGKCSTAGKNCFLDFNDNEHLEKHYTLSMEYIRYISPNYTILLNITNVNYRHSGKYKLFVQSKKRPIGDVHNLIVQPFITNEIWTKPHKSFVAGDDILLIWKLNGNKKIENITIQYGSDSVNFPNPTRFDKKRCTKNTNMFCSFHISIFTLLIQKAHATPSTEISLKVYLQGGRVHRSQRTTIVVEETPRNRWKAVAISLIVIILLFCVIIIVGFLFAMKKGIYLIEKCMGERNIVGGKPQEDEIKKNTEGDAEEKRKTSTSGKKIIDIEKKKTHKFIMPSFDFIKKRSSSKKSDEDSVPLNRIQNGQSFTRSIHPYVQQYKDCPPPPRPKERNTTRPKLMSNTSLHPPEIPKKDFIDMSDAIYRNCDDTTTGGDVYVVTDCDVDLYEDLPANK